MKTIERNYRRNPHTARFLMAFHSANGANNTSEARALELEAAQDDDLLDLVPADAVADLRTTPQAELMERLIAQITELNSEDGEKARAYTLGMTEHGRWTAGREGNASAWISKMIAKVSELKAAARTAPAQPTTGTAVSIPAGRYAVETDEIRCYSVEYGKDGTRWEGFTFLNRISSDDRYPIKSPAEKARILDAIRADVDAAGLLAAMTLRICRGTMKNGQPCGRTLSDTKNPYFSQGYGPECGKNL